MMSDVIIKGMEMPINCISCPFMISRIGDDCTLQSHEANCSFRSWADMRKGCPIRPAPEWIGVEKRMPGPFDTVLISVASRNGYGEPASWQTIGGSLCGQLSPFIGALAEGERITHWMPLPEPPEVSA